MSTAANGFRIEKKTTKWIPGYYNRLYNLRQCVNAFTDILMKYISHQQSHKFMASPF